MSHKKCRPLTPEESSKVKAGRADEPLRTTLSHKIKTVLQMTVSCYFISINIQQERRLQSYKCLSLFDRLLYVKGPELHLIPFFKTSATALTSHYRTHLKQIHLFSHTEEIVESVLYKDKLKAKIDIVYYNFIFTQVTVSSVNLEKKIKQF